MIERKQNIISIEQKLIYLILIMFKTVRYIYRISYKIIRLFYRIFKTFSVRISIILEPYIIKLQEKIYIRACKVFDIKTEKLRK